MGALGNTIRKRMGLPPLLSLWFLSSCYFTPLLPLVEQSRSARALDICSILAILSL
jgi:hypothetical protein